MQTQTINTYTRIRSAYTTGEAKFLKPWQTIRQVILHPIIQIFVICKITPNMLSYASVVLGAGFAIFVSTNFTLAFWLLIASILCDALDGVLARQLKTDSFQGAFTDAICDQTVLAFSVIAMILKGAINPVLGVMFVYVYTTFIMFIILHNVLGVASEFLIRPGRNIFFIAIGVYYFFNPNLLNYFILVSVVTIPLLFISFKRLQSAL